MNDELLTEARRAQERLIDAERDLDVAVDVITSGRAARTVLGTMNTVPEARSGVRCNFCGKDRGQVERVAILPEVTVERTSSSAAVCSECLVLCQEIITEEDSLDA